MKIKIKDFLKKWNGDFRIEDVYGSVFGDATQLLAPDLLDKEIADIKLDQTMCPRNGYKAVLIINNTSEPELKNIPDYPAEHYVIAVDQNGLEMEAYAYIFEADEQTDIETLARQAAIEYCRTPEGAKVYQENGRCFDWGDFNFIPDNICKKYGFRQRYFTPSITVDFNERLVTDEDMRK